MGGLLSKSQPNVEKPKTGSADRVQVTFDRGELAIFHLKHRYIRVLICFLSRLNHYMAVSRLRQGGGGWRQKQNYRSTIL